MAFKPPSYAITNVFYRIVPDSEQVKTSNKMVLRGKCPLCQDYKKRMYCIEYGDHYHIYCQNCGYSAQFQTFIKDEFPTEQSQLKEFIIDSIKSGEAFKKNKPKKKDNTPRIEYDLKLRVYMSEMSFSLGEAQETSLREYYRKKAIEYCEGRRISEKYWNEFRFFTHGTLKGYIGIPMWDDNKNDLVHIQGRLFAGNSSIQNQQKYLFLKDTNHGIDNIPKPIYGTWRVDKEKMVYVCEGTLDCLAFGDQGVATCGATISEFFIGKVKKKFPNRVWCMDNYWDDEAGRKLTDKLLEMGESCFIIPKRMKSKDANALLQEMDVDVLPEEFIEKNTYTGNLGKVKLDIIK